MRTLFVFGDSFSQNMEEEWSWTRLLGKQLNVNGLYNASSVGVANDWILLNFRKQLDKITKDSIVIIVITHPNRYWLLREQPEYSNFYVANLPEFITKEEAEAIKGYAKHIQKDELDLFRLEQQVAWIKETQQKIGFDLLLIPAFDVNINYENLIPVLGDLTSSVSCAEFVSPEDEKTWYYESIDTRCNHMIKNNHEILVHKLMKSLMTKEPLDLAVGFRRGFLKASEKYTHKGLGRQLIIQAKELKEKSSGAPGSSHWLDK